MSATGPAPTGNVVLGLDGLEALISALAVRGYDVLGPTERDGAIVYDRITGIADLPAGRTDRQEPGSYRLEDAADGALFGYAVGPHSWKRFLHRPLERCSCPPHRRGTQVRAAARTARAPCLHRRARLRAGRHRHPGPGVPGWPLREHRICRPPRGGVPRRGQLRRPGRHVLLRFHGGPVRAPADGFDLALTELLDGRHAFLAEPGTDAGAALLAILPARPASDADRNAARAVAARAEANMGRRMPTAGLKDALQQNPEHPRWEDGGARCLACANCTMVCPTCFCTTVEDHSDITDTVRSVSGAGIPASPAISPTCMAARCAPRRARATGNG